MFFDDGETCDIELRNNAISCGYGNSNFLGNFFPPNVTSDFTYSVGLSRATLSCGVASPTIATKLFVRFKAQAPDGTPQEGENIQTIPANTESRAVSNPGFAPNVFASGDFLAKQLPPIVATCNASSARLVN